MSCWDALGRVIPIRMLLDNGAKFSGSDAIIVPMITDEYC